MEFRCGAENASATHSGLRFIGCTNGGTCRITLTGQQFCTCPAGWQADHVGFGHFDNCSLPQSFVRLFFIVFSAVALPCLLIQSSLLFRAWYIGSSLRPGIPLSLLWQWCNWIHVLCVYSQDGFYEAAALSLIAYLSIGYIVGAHALVAFMEPVAILREYNHSFRSLKRRIFVFFPCAAIVVSSFLFASVAYAGSESTSIFNLLMFLMILVSVLAITVTQTSIILAARRLDQLFEATTLGESYSSTKLTEVQLRIRFQLRSVVRACMAFGIGNVCMICCLCVWAIYGQFPYLYIGWTLQFILGFVTYPVTFVVLCRLSRPEPKSTRALDGFSRTPESQERRGFETIVIKNSSNPFGKVRSKFKRRQRAAPKNLDLTIINEEQHETTF